MNSRPPEYDRIILGIDPGTNIMGYGLLGVVLGKPHMIATGVIELGKIGDHYMRLARIYERVLGIVEQYLPDELAIEAPFFGKNVQSMLKLGRAQGVAMAAALSRQVPITEYEPRKIKQAITGNGAAAKEQVRMMLTRILGLDETSLPEHLDATDALGAALCHFYESAKPGATGGCAPPRRQRGNAGSWADFVSQNPDRIAKK